MAETTENKANPTLDKGAKAPALTATTDEGKAINLAEVYKKGLVLVYFYPKADTPGCTKQACNLRDNISALNNAGVTVIGVSADTVEAQAKFKAKYALNFTLLADKERQVIGAFGVTARQSFIVKNGGVVWRQLKASPATQAEDALKAIGSL